MSPRYSEVLLLHIVGRTFIAAHILYVTHIKSAVEAIALGVVRLGIESPRAFGVNLSGQCQVDIIVERQVVTAIAQIEAIVVVFAEGGHYDTRRIRRCEGEIAEWHGYGQGHAFEHHICRTGNDVFLWFYLTFGDEHIEVRFVVVVAGGVFAVLNEIFILIHHLGDAAGEVTFALLGDDVSYQAFFALEVVAHGLGGVGAALVFKHGIALQLAHAVGHAHGIYLVFAHFHLYLIGCEVDVAILHFARAVHICVVLPLYYERILGGKVHHIVEVDKVGNKSRFLGFCRGFQAVGYGHCCRVGG